MIQLLMVLLAFVACQEKEDTSPKIPETETSSTTIYPKPPSAWVGTTNPYYTAGWVGDIMPFYDKGKFHIYFLHDAKIKPEGKGFHSIHQFESTDLVDFDYKGEAISFGKADEPDFAIGTGSVLPYEDEYLFYYTGHNGNEAFVQQHPRESVLFASSQNLQNWEKNEDFILTAPNGYYDYEFRDPHVFYNEEAQEYWMIQSTQYQDSRKAVLLLFTSQNPLTDPWEAQDPLYVSSEEEDYLMLECPDIFKMGDYWYLLFSEWGIKGTHYRMADSSTGPWRKPENDRLDGEYFFAAKTASDGDKRYAFGWTARKMPENDQGNKQWAGNMVIHELVQQDNGELGLKAPNAINALFDQEKPLESLSSTGQVQNNSDDYQLDGMAGFSSVNFAELEGSQKISAHLSFLEGQGVTGFAFGLDNDFENAYRIGFFPEENKIKAFNGTNTQVVTEVDVDLSAGETYKVEIICSGSIAVMYINGQAALSNRIYSMQNQNWGIYAQNNSSTFGKLKLAEENQ
ncbi:glycoside hydrolase family 32 protein [Echinicola jeungdonensis]|uniref:beta-fructofuranosidase n=1 Tax=Echinicola jeungdonensis TaxID=709343 RepID=A0ABV5J901_9BACT|nr:glycoside hydrolase family 32 protein [Echinicola jeungdonensis]MDN3669188.1 glycoside hydrolase family 32 protein [Echinicola jeungdonensis]